MINIGDVNMWFKIVLKHKDRWCDDDIMDKADDIVRNVREKREAKKAREKKELEARRTIRQKIMLDYNIHGITIPNKKRMNELIDQELEGKTLIRSTL